MIANDGAEARVSHKQLEDFFALRTFGDQVSDTNHAIVVADTDLFEQFDQFIVTTMKISHYNSATSHQLLRRVLQLNFAVYCIARIQANRES